MLREAIDSPLVAQVCAEIKDAWEQKMRGEITPEEFEELKGRLKKQLPILTPHATFKNGRRLNSDAVPSGLSMYDLDHIPDPEGRWREIEPRKDELGIVIAHITPSAEGLRLIFVIPDGKTLADAQRWMADQLGDQKYDECVKDYARCSFIVPREYVLYMSDKLFGPTPSLPVREGERTPSIPLQGEEAVTTATSTHHTDCPPETGGTSAERGGGGFPPISYSLPIGRVRVGLWVRWGPPQKRPEDVISSGRCYILRYVLINWR